MKNVLSAAVIAAVAGAAGAASASDIQLAGSSTVLPYAKTVQAQFKEVFPKFNVVVEGGGSSKGKKLVCENAIDIGNASSRNKDKEKAYCAEKGVELIEFAFGYDGIVFAYDNKGDKFDLTPTDVYKALNKTVGGKPNTAKTLKDVNSALPAWKIAFYIPAENHGTREVFDKKVMHAGCKAVGDFDVFKKAAEAAGEKKPKKVAAKKCADFRVEDGSVVEIAGNYNETLKRIDSNKTGVGVFGLAFYEANKAKLAVAKVEGVVPTAAKVASGEYPVSRPLYFYVNKARLKTTAGLSDFVAFWLSDEVVGPGSEIVNNGLVAAPDGEREANRKKLADGTVLK